MTDVPPPNDDVGFDLEIVPGEHVFVVVTVAAMVAMIWVYLDARGRDVQNPGIWAAAIGFLFLFYVVPGIAALIVYIAVRDADFGSSEDRSP